MPRLMRLLIGSACLLALSACDQNSTSPSVSLAGSYSLRMVNGQPLPYQYTTSDGTNVQLNADVLTMNPDGSYTDVSQLQTFQGSFTNTEYGTYSANNGSVTFFDQTDGITYSGSLSGSVLTEITGNLTQVYQKQ